LDSNFANQKVGGTIDEMFSTGLDMDIQHSTPFSVPTPAPASAAKNRFRGLIEEVFSKPNNPNMMEDGKMM